MPVVYRWCPFHDHAEKGRLLEDGTVVITDPPRLAADHRRGNVADENDCLHGLDKRWCAACKDPAPNPHAAKPAPTIVATFPARYEGDCDACGFAIEPGQTIHRMSDDRYVHARCEKGSR